MNDSVVEYFRSEEVRIFILVACLLLLFAHWGGTNAWSRYDLSSAMVENGSVEITSVSNNTRDKIILSEEYNEHIDLSPKELLQLRSENRSLYIKKTTEAYDRAFDNPETVYTDKAPLSSILAAPAYFIVDSILNVDSNRWSEGVIASEIVRAGSGMFLMQLAIVFTVSVIPGALLAVLIFRICFNYVDRELASYTAILTVISTPIFFYSSSFYGVVTAAFFCVFSYWSAERYLKSKAIRYLLASGISLSFAFSTEYYSILFIAPLLGYLALRGLREDLAFFVIGLILGSIPLLIYNWLTTGNPLSILKISPYIAAPGPINAVCEVYATCHEGTNFFFGGLIDLSRLLNNTVRLLFLESRGLFYYSPVLLMSLIGVFDLYRKDKRILVIFPGAFFLFLIFQASRLNWMAGVSFGPRYAIVGLPFLSLPLALGIRRTLDKSMLFKAGLALLIVVSVFNSVLAFNFMPAELSDTNYSDRYADLKPIQPEVYDHLLDQFMEKGPRSPVLMETLGVLQDESLQYNNAYAQSYIDPNYRNYVVDTRFLPLTAGLILLTVYLATSKSKFTYLVFVLLLVSLWLNVDTVSDQELIYNSWHEAESDETRWSEEDPELFLYRESFFDGNKIVSMDLRSLNKTRDVRLYLNGEEKQSWTVDNRYSRYWFLFSPDKGLNNIRFEIEGKCENIGSVAGNDDSRCTKIGLRNLEIKDIGEKNVYLSGDEEGRLGRDGTREILIRKPGNYSVEFDGRASEESNISVYRDSDYLSSTVFDRFPSNFSTPYFRSEGFSKITIRANCDRECPEIDISGFEVKNYKYQSGDLLYRLGYNWYTKLAAENYRWSRSNNSIYVYSYRNSSVDRIIWVEGRSFGEERDFEYRWNGEKLGVREVPTTAYRIAYRTENGFVSPEEYENNGTKVRLDNKYGFNVTVEPGENVLELRSNRSCISFAKVNENDDVRCGSYGLKRIYLTEQR